MDRNNFGYLLVNVRYARGAMPVMGAAVELMLDGKSLGEYMTDIDGKTQIIKLPSDEGYYIRVRAPLFENQEYGPIPVIKDITTLQNINLFPSIVFEKGDMRNDV